LLTALFSGFSSRIAVSIYRSRTADYLVGIVVRTVACQLACRANASNKKEGWCQPAGEARMLWTVFAILLLLWLLGWGFHVAGSLIHLILVIALIVLLVEVITGRRAAI